VALIALSFAVGAGVFGAALAKNLGAIAFAQTIGATLVLGGVAQLLTPVPQIPQGVDAEQDPRKSYSFSGVQQTSRQGVPVPICYGETLVGSVVISAGVDTVQVAG
jgi:predicted phage tail protein